MLNGKEREMGLGSLADVKLAEARQSRDDYRKLLRTGVDPIEARKHAQLQEALAKSRSITFSDAATAYIDAQRASWKNAKHAEQWTNTIATYCRPVFGDLPVQTIDTEVVLKALQAIWTTKPETADRLRGRIERILDWARVRGYRAGDNPARWRGHLDKLLPRLEKRKRVKHHPALSFADIPSFMTALRQQSGISARALELLILTATRTNEAINARWAEVDIEGGVWAIPAARMKTHTEHRVPLSKGAAAVLQRMHAARLGEYVFPGHRSGQPLSNMALLALLKRMCRDDITVHGFRSTFRDWASERTSYPRDVCEMALAHAVTNATEAAYRRGDLFEKRRQLMESWATYCEAYPGKADVLPLKRQQRSGA